MKAARSRNIARSIKPTWNLTHGVTEQPWFAPQSVDKGCQVAIAGSRA